MNKYKKYCFHPFKVLKFSKKNRKVKTHTCFDLYFYSKVLTKLIG